MPQRNPRMQSVDPSRFAMVPRADVPRSGFDVQTSHRTTFQGGHLIPVHVQEVLPGDSVRLNMTAFARLATPIVPVMDNITLESFFFFVPNRLVWENWERFMGEQASPTDTTAFLVPQVDFDEGALFVGSLGDYMGVTTNFRAESEISVNSLPFRGYFMIWNEWFRDQDLQDPLVVPLGDGPDDGVTPLFNDTQHRGKRHDYFTSARPWPQKPMNTLQLTSGDPFVPGGNMLLPQSGAPVTGLGVASGNIAAVVNQDTIWSGGRFQPNVPLSYGSTTDEVFLRATAAGNYPDVRVLVNDIRTAVAVQGIMERNARGGTRYSELIRSHFGVTSPDARLQRPEYLGGGRARITVNPVAQTSGSGATGTTTVLGELAGVATVVATGHGFSQSFTEHGFIIGLLMARADQSYQHGVNRFWFRRTQFDYYWPGLAHLGEQAILQREIFADGSPLDVGVFGYQERWSEYKYMPRRVSGAFRSTAPESLDMWHLAEAWTSVDQPALDGTWIEETPPLARVLQVATTFGQQFLLDTEFSIRMVRAMPMFSLPGLGPRL